jgi:valyl-tRNA synthetase
MGHALQSSVQDCLIRLKRMQGYESLWMPGIDHAGIATQNVVARLIREKEGTTRHDLGRDAFVDRVWEWKEKYGGIITDQQKKLGASCDWRRMRFTMDEGFTRAVQTVFVQLFKEGLIYRGDYLVNWCPVDRTAISNEEVDNVERDGHLWYVNYPLADGSGMLTIATTRPETMLGDTAIAVNPSDKRYTDIIGKKAILPLLEREIPIIGDDYVRVDFGAGALKVTPGHDENDFEIGKRHNLQFLNIMNPDGTINENGGPYAGLDRFVARERVVEDLEAAGLLVKIEPYKVSLPISNRSLAVIEPLISRQWFVKMQPFADRALDAARTGKVVFHPKRWRNEYYRWLEEIRDWTISRQLWWGHRIPVWYYTDEEGNVDESRDFAVSVEQPEPGMVQDEDVLDTWFSSWLWPFATLGWPDKTDALDKFYPTDVLVSGYDILFFWISRMIMAGQHFTDQEPYRDVFITGMIKDKYGRWMSKSLGNGIDPLDMIEQYGADAVRFSLIILCAQGQDIKLDPLKFEMGRNFANKIWNAFNVFGRFMEDGKDYRRERSFEELRLVERWMLHSVNSAIPKINAALDRYRLNEALGIIYDVFWHDYCDWFLELIKPNRGEGMKDETIALALEIYEKLTLLLHPFMPFITEEMWWRIRPRKELDACISAKWPETNAGETDAGAAKVFSVIQEITTGVRHIRSKQNVPPSKRIEALVNLGEDEHGIEDALQRFSPYLDRLAGVSDLTIGFGIEKPPASAVDIVGTHEVFVPLAGLIDLDTERERLQKEIEQKERFLAGVRRKLENEQFLAKAPEAVVEKEKAKEQDASAEIEKLKLNLAELD